MSSRNKRDSKQDARHPIETNNSNAKLQATPHFSQAKLSAKVPPANLPPNFNEKDFVIFK